MVDTKRIVCDSSSLISLSDNCLLGIIGNLRSVRFIVPMKVREEIIDNPLRTKRFELKAVLMDNFLKNSGLEIFNHPKIPEYSKYYTDLANGLFRYKGRDIKIIQEGEASGLACLKILKEDSMLVDERTTRLLIEDMDLLKKYIEKRTNLTLDVNVNKREQLEEELSRINVMRSSELFAYAFDKGYFTSMRKQVLEGGLWGLKFSGCSITEDEINDYLKLLG